jgi:phosphoglycolate phosphatase
VARTLLLDLDGTLVDTAPDLAAALNRLMIRRGLPSFTQAETAGFVGDGVAALVRKAFARRGRQADQAAIEEFSADYVANAAVASKLYPNVLGTLRDLAGDGWRLAVCTNKPEAAARSLLAALGVLDMMVAVGAGDSFPVRKPDPAHLTATLALAGGRADQALMLGDNAHDVTAGHGAGMRVIFAAWGYAAPGMEAGADAIAPDITAVPPIARRLLPP